MPERIRLILYRAGAAILLAALTAGCGSMATRKGFYEPIAQEVETGNYQQAAAGLEQAKADGKFGEKDRVVYFIDAGMAYHYAGEYDTSNTRLQAAESSAEDLFTKSISKAALSLVLNDNALDYAGEDYEVLYTNLIGALNYIADDNYEDAFVEVRRANLKLEVLNQKYADAATEFRRGALNDTNKVDIDYEAEKVRFQNSAFARYLSMRMYAGQGKRGDAELDYELLHHAFETQPFIYDFPVPDVKFESDDGAILSVVALVGLSPVKESLSLRIRTDKDLDLVQILYDDPNNPAEYGHLPIKVSEDYYFKFAIPQLVDRPSAVSHVEVYVDGQLLGQLQLLEDVGLVARETFAAKKSLIYLRSVARAVVKGLIAHREKEKIDKSDKKKDDQNDRRSGRRDDGEDDGGSLGGWLKKLLVDVAMDLSENADLRCARLLPGRVLVGDFVVPPGEHDVRIAVIGQAGQTIAVKTYPGYQVIAGKANLLEAVAPQ